MRRGKGHAVASTENSRRGISSTELPIPIQRHVGGEEFVPYVGQVFRGRVGDVNALLLDGVGGVVVGQRHEHVESSGGIWILAAGGSLLGIVLPLVLCLGGSLFGDVFDFSLSATALRRGIDANAHRNRCGLGPTSEDDGSNSLLAGGVGILDGRGGTALRQGQEDDAARQSTDDGNAGAYHLHGRQAGELGRTAVGVVVVQAVSQLAAGATRGRGHPPLLEVIALLHRGEEVLSAHGPEGVTTLGHDGLGGQTLPGGTDELAKDPGGVGRARTGRGGRLAAAGRVLVVDVAGSAATARRGDLVS